MKPIASGKVCNKNEKADLKTQRTGLKLKTSIKAGSSPPVDSSGLVGPSGPDDLVGGIGPIGPLCLCPIPDGAVY